MSTRFEQAQEFMSRNGIDGWLTRDYRYTNPVFWQIFGHRVQNLTRPVFLMVPAAGTPSLMAHEVDAGRFEQAGAWPGGEVSIRRFSSRDSMIEELRALVATAGAPAPVPAPVLAMEYSGMYRLPRIGLVDAGTIELVRSLGATIVSSGDLVQYSTERWSPAQLESHRFAVERLTRIVKEAFTFAGENVRWALTEHDLAEHIRGRFDRLDLEYDDGPVVAFDENSSDPHYEPLPGQSAVIRRNGWLLVDLWGRRRAGKGGDAEPNISADITWAARLGSDPEPEQSAAFSAVRSARDAAFDFIEEQVFAGNAPQGWQVDRVARDVIEKAGYGERFFHRLGHSLGYEVHSNGVNLDGWETHDTRSLVEGIGVTIEPGVYLPGFGVRLEMDVYMRPDGPEITGERQDEIYRVET